MITKLGRKNQTLWTTSHLHIVGLCGSILRQYTVIGFGITEITICPKFQGLKVAQFPAVLDLFYKNS